MAWIHIKSHWTLWLITLVIFGLWSSPIIVPVKIFIVFLHEFSHVLATWLTGGKVMALSISAQQGGAVTSQGGNSFIIASAGYLGSLILGAMIFILALRAQIDRWVVACLGGIMLILTLFYIRDLFSVAFCVVGGLLFLSAALFLSRTINDILLRVIGLTSMVYVPFDIFSDTLQRSHLRSDARIIAETMGGPTLFWGGLWFVLSLIVIYFVLRVSLRTPSTLSPSDRASA
ncbi:peptidase M50B-like protein [Litorimonas taeanensis]|uniref:Peptidase M50B-like protein n=1 Tax=Litorimonas taeanensis TaxID=568099 RepID=A0A420WEM1_9PROT|nr:peptidase M50B-like protein [Litorimonas taeanensis]